MFVKFNSSEGIFEIEDDILLFIQNHIRDDIPDRLMKTFTTLGDKGIFWGCTAIIMAISDKYKKTGVKLGISQGIGAIITNLTTKNAVRRPRPFDVIDGLSTLIPPPSDWSFPSGHTTSSIAAGTLLLICMPKKIGIPAFITGIIISLSRVYVGVHYPSDVIAGAAAGVIAALASDKAVEKFLSSRRKLPKHL